MRKDALIKIDEFRNNKQTKSYTHDKNYKSPLINPRLPFVKHDEVKMEKIVHICLYDFIYYLQKLKSMFFEIIFFKNAILKKKLKNPCTYMISPKNCALFSVCKLLKRDLLLLLVIFELSFILQLNLLHNQKLNHICR